MSESHGRHPARIIDANANRAREALRVLEDGARFLLDDQDLTAALKTLRHDLVAALAKLPDGLLLAHRATDRDEGRAVTTDGEHARADADAVVQAAAARCSEALRSLEEWTKTLDSTLAAEVESIRYRAYEVTGVLLMKLSRPTADWRLAVLVTQSLCRQPWRDVIVGAIEGGADCIQIREKDLSDGELLDLVREAVALARPHNVAVIVNDRVDIALAADADGVHLGTGDIPLSEARVLSGGRLLIGCSVHNHEEAEAAIGGGCDYCGVGTMFETRTKPDLNAVGPAFLSSFVERYPEMPHLAIGGIDASRASDLATIGCRGVAISSAVCGADDPVSATGAIVEALGAQSAPSETTGQ